MEALFFGTLEAHPTLSRSQHQHLCVPAHIPPAAASRRPSSPGTGMHSTPFNSVEEVIDGLRRTENVRA
eukprot:COSAG04_NODE_68_length_29323_cov_9.683514_3_plen_69_part_00